MDLRYRRCRKCRKLKRLLRDFYRYGGAKRRYGFRRVCRSCEIQRVHAAQLAAPRRKQAADQRYYQRHCASRMAYNAKRRGEDREAYNEYMREYSHKHRAAIRITHRLSQGKRRVMLRGSAIQRSFTPTQWLAVLAAFGGLCAYCNEPATSMDHVVPVSRGGAHSISNVVPACRSCNSRKGARTGTEFLALLEGSV